MPNSRLQKGHSQSESIWQSTAVSCGDYNFLLLLTEQLFTKNRRHFLHFFRSSLKKHHHDITLWWMASLMLPQLHWSHVTGHDRTLCSHRHHDQFDAENVWRTFECFQGHLTLSDEKLTPITTMMGCKHSNEYGYKQLIYRTETTLIIAKSFFM